MSTLKLKNFLTVLLTCLSVQVFAQTVTVTGSVTMNGNAVSGIPVQAYTSTNNVAGTAFTNASGNYSLNLPNAGSQGVVSIHITDCDSSILLDTLFYNPGNYSITNDFIYCANPGGGSGGGGGSLPCDASFYHVDSIPSVVFFYSAANNPSTSYYWTFGDGTTSTQANPSHSYAQNGLYAVCLNVIDSANNCTDSYCDSIYIGNASGGGNGGGSLPCDAYFTYTDSIAFAMFWSSANNASASYYWTFGDGATSTQSNPDHYYAQSGTYLVCLTVTDSANNCTDTYCDSITVGQGNPGGGGNGGGSLPCDAYFYSIDSVSTMMFYSSANNASASYYWTFGDGTTSTQAYPNHTYAQNGSYLVCLTVTDSANNCSDTYCDSVFVGQGNPGGGNGGNGNPPCNAQFISIDSAGMYMFYPTVAANTFSYSWSFGDGNTSSAMFPTHTYAQNGVYTVCLTVSDSLNNCTATFCDSVFIGNGNPGGGSGNAGSIMGAVFTNNTPVNIFDAMVYLITYDSTVAGNGILVAVDSTLVDSAGIYSFYNVPAGNYFVKAALMSTSPDYNNYLPTYHTSALHWTSATTVVPTFASVFYDINMIGGTNTGGPGFIGGLVSQGANKTAAEGDPIENALVILLDNNDNPVTYTYSDANGKFEFDQIALGTYKVYTEVTGLSTNPVTVTINQNEDSEEKVMIKINSSSVDGFIDTTSSIEDVISASISAYPNPLQDVLSVNTGLAKGDIQLNVYDVSGRVVLTKVVEANGQVINLDVTSMTKGLYIMNVKGNDFETSYKLIK